MRPTDPRWLPAIGIVAVLCLALLTSRASPPPPAPAAGEGAAAPLAAEVDPAAGQAGAAGPTGQHHHPPGWVADRLAGDREAVAFCVSASLEPFAATRQQFLTDGPDEVTTRLQQCVFDTIIGHGPVGVLAELETHRPHLQDCLTETIAAGPPAATKAAAVGEIAGCIAASAVP